ncbi:linear amide C-N hydrolase [Mycobacterium sp. Lab-001]|uniref:linear amide C-N hydrolase n=1 Tax=Mycobacterium sp. Lab-001 TaxID=3410136 RepID=UPI003D170479
MCTRVMWPDAGDVVLVGRNMDFHKDLMTNLWKQPRGVTRDDGVAGKLTWNSKYGSVIAAAFDIISVDGINEAGLAGHVLWLAESSYGTPDDSRTQLSQAIWLQYYLDNFATVAEAVAWTGETNPQVVQMDDPTGGNPPAIHLALDDATGDSAIIEYVDGHPNVYHSRDFRVMTNSPTFDQQLELVKNFEGLGGAKPLPGSTLASDRFARASFYAGRLPEPSNQVEAIASMFSVIRNAAQPFRVPDPGKPDASQTIWQVVLDLTNKRYVYESTTRPNIVWVDLADLDFAEGSSQLKLDLISDFAVQGGIAGNVGGKFKDMGPMTFLSLSLLRELEKAKASSNASTAQPTAFRSTQ